MPSKAIDAESLLALCPLFRTLDPEARRALAQEARFRTLPARQPLFHQGDMADGLYIVASGLIRVWITDEDGNELTLSLPDSGEPLGEMALFDGQPRSANATALDQAVVLFIERSAIDRMLATDLRLAHHVIALLAERLRQANARLHGLAFDSLRQRLCQTLLDLAKAHATETDGEIRFERKLSQSALATILGVSREAVNKQFRALALDGLIDTRSGLALTNPKKLEKIVARL